MIFACCTEDRLHELRAHAILNGIDFLEVLDRTAPVALARQKTLLVKLVKPVPPVADLALHNVLIEGGERIRDIKVDWMAAADAVNSTQAPSTAERNFYHDLPEADRILVVRTDRAGDFSPYRLRLGVNRDNPQPLKNFDPVSSVVNFSFKVECPTDLDCQPQHECADAVQITPDINYLAKDYAGFRRLLLDRLSVLMPDWRERSPADLGVTLVELLAFVADRLSYQQDAVATEAYLGTARRRVSVRRHARLVDYRMHDGCNARTWVHVDVGADNVVIPAETPVITKIPDAGAAIIPPVVGVVPDDVLLRKPTVFLTVREATFFELHNLVKLYTWGEQRCCLPQGATRATLQGALSNLHADDVLIFVEWRGASTGNRADADLSHRHAVRLLEVVSDDGAGGPLLDPLTLAPITEIRWAPDDALPIAFTVSTGEGGTLVDDVTVVLGNNVLADHGMWVRGEELDAVIESPLLRRASTGTVPCATSRLVPAPIRYQPRLKLGDITQRVDPYPPHTDARPATVMLGTDPRTAAPVVKLRGVEGAIARDWEARPDLLGSESDDRHFVVEVDDGAVAALRFGNDQNGRRPLAGTEFRAAYRSGNGAAGNLGADTLAHLVTNVPGVAGVGNPLAARGGMDAEGVDDVRAYAPFAFRRQERAVTEKDYQDLCRRRPEVQRAAASLRWTGSWHTAFVTVDRLGGAQTDAVFGAGLEQFLDRFRMAGVDLAVDAPRFVSLEIDMQVCVKSEHLRANVRDALARRLGNRSAASRRGFFHPDNFSFGQTVFLSEIYRAAQAVPGVDSVRITRFRRQGTRDTRALADARIELGRLEIARLDNDPNYPEHGVLRLQMAGGK
jgi:hypothetical protein